MDSVLELIGGVLLAIFLAAFIALILAWPVMLLIGVLHSVLPVVPAIGFWTTFLVILIVRLIVAG